MQFSLRQIAISIRIYMLVFFDRSGIHGFFYFSYELLHYVERLMWLCIISSMFGVLGMLGMQSVDRYLHHSTVVTIERDHYYWNITLPGLTVCPITERLNRTLFDEYMVDFSPELSKDEQSDLFVFLESLANSTFINFQDIKPSPIVEKLNIQPADYMFWIYNLTEDWSRRIGGSIHEYKVRTMVDRNFVETEQVLTEFGICYSTNTVVLYNTSAMWQMLRRQAMPLRKDQYYDDKVIYDIVAGNQFDGEVGYTSKGYNSGYIKIFLHSPYDIMDVSRKDYVTDQMITFNCLGVMIVSDEDFREEMSISQRGCRYRYENNLDNYPVFTKGMCQQECRLNLVHKLCGCVPHFYPNRGANRKVVCHYRQLMTCVANYSAALLQLRDPETWDGICSCDQNCEELNVMVENIVVLANTDDLLGSSGGIIQYQNYPMIRYKRKVMFSWEDLLVSTGGTAGLLTGFCVLGAFEIIFFLTLRLFWYMNGRK